MQKRIIDYITVSLRWYEDKSRYLELYNYFSGISDEELVNKISKYDKDGICEKYFFMNMTYSEIASCLQNSGITIKKRCVNAINNYVSAEIEMLALKKNIGDVYLYDLNLPERVKSMIFRNICDDNVYSKDPTVNEIIQISPQDLLNSVPHFGVKMQIALYRYLHELGAELTEQQKKIIGI